MRDGAGKLAPGIDVRGEGGYVIMPPSPGYSVIHHRDLLGDGANPARHLTRPHHHDAEIVDWPPWLL